jgi:hypothetical protein
MRLPKRFPHTRQEQYLVALPVELLSDDEALRAALVIRRLQRHLDLIILRSIARLREVGVSDEEIDRVIAAAG